MRFIPTSIIFTLLFAVALAVPTSASADTLDDLIARVQSMMEEMAKVQVQLLELKSDRTTSAPAVTTSASATGSVLGATSFKFAGPVTTGDTSEDVKKIQQLLKTDSEIYPEGITSGFYGPATTQAIRNLQTRFGLNPVGVVGPATTALLERLISQQNNDGTYPSDILDPARPTGAVAGVNISAGETSTTNPLIQKLLDQVAQLQEQQGSTGSSNTTSNSSNSNVSRIVAEIDDGETLVKIFYKNNDFKSFWAASDDKDDVVEETADEYGLSVAEVEDLIEFDDFDAPSSSDSDEIDEIVIEVDVEDGEADVEVYFEDEDEDTKEFTVDEVDLADIIEEIADELDIDEDDVYDLMDLDYNIDADDIDEINADIDEDEGETEVTIELESGDEFEIIIDEDDEDDVIDELADLLDIDVDDIEDLIDF